MFNTGGCEPPTQAQYVVVLVGVYILCLLLGLTGFGFWFFAPPEDAEQAEMLRTVSTMITSIGLLAWLGRWVIKRLVG